MRDQTGGNPLEMFIVLVVSLIPQIKIPVMESQQTTVK